MKFDAGAYECRLFLGLKQSCGSHPPKIFHLEQKCKESIASGGKKLKV